ncbi:MAG: hypothetical protein IPK19_03895 [Chloroflexi bacterium]|nr:hypothetical protein [Chloroflexota bacterium]
MIRIISSAANAARANEVMADLKQVGISAEAGAPARGDVLVAVLSSADAEKLPGAAIDALDMGLHLLIVKLEPFELPKLIDHVPSVDIAAPDYRQQLAAHIADLSSGNAPYAMRVRTPKVKQSNRSTGILVGSLALIMFIIGLIGVGVFGLQAPREEYDDIDTQVALTRDYLAGPELQYFSTWLPRSTEDAANYEATLQQLPTAYRPLMGLTVTAYALGTPLPPITTPVPEG